MIENIEFKDLTPKEQVLVGQATGWDGVSYHRNDGLKITLKGDGEVAKYDVEYPSGIERDVEPVNGVTPEVTATADTAPAEEVTATDSTPVDDTIVDAATDNLPVPEPTQDDVTANDVATDAPQA